MNTSPLAPWFYADNDTQQGPITFSELQKKLASGLSPESLVWNEEMTDWVPAKTIPALVANLSDNPYATPASGDDLSRTSTLDADGFPEPPVPLSPTFCISQGWKHFKDNLGLVLITGLVFFVVSILINLLAGVVPSSSLEEAPPFEIAEGISIPIPETPSGPIGVLVGIVTHLFELALGLGVSMFLLNIVRGDHAEVTDLFSKWEKTLHAFVAEILYGLIFILGLVCLIVPGIFFAIRLSQYQFAIVEKDLGPIEALKYSYRLTQDNCWSYIGFILLTFVVALAGLLALGIGLIAAIPVIMIANAVVYRYLHGGPEKLKTLP